MRSLISPREGDKKVPSVKRRKILDKNEEVKKDDILNGNNYEQEGNKEDTLKKEKLSEEEKQRIIDILKKIKVHVVKGYFDSARALIIEGLAIDKFNKDLNMNLASIYEKEKKFQNAEYIYRDLSEVLQDDFEVKKKLGFNLAMQSKFKDALDMYESAHKQKKSDNEIISMLTDITYDMKDYKKCLRYVSLFLKEKPRDVEKMFMKCVCLEALGSNDEKSINEIINMYKKILELQPYNTMARDRLKDLDKQLNTIGNTLE